MRMVAPKFCTPDMVRAMPADGNRYETVHGELLVTPSPAHPHQRILTNLMREVLRYCDATGVGEVLVSPGDLSLTEDSLVQPDLFVVPPQRADATWRELGMPLLVAEILSPSTARQDRLTKRMHYLESGVPVYWIIDGRTRSVEVWRRGASRPEVECERVVWSPSGVRQALILELAAVFR